MQNEFIAQLSALLPSYAANKFADLRLIVGVSGGVDSVLLLYLLHKANINCVVAHVNFQLRGEESERDMIFVEALAQKLGFACAVARVDTLEYAKIEKLSVQVAARNLRYDFFEQLRQKHGAHFIATAQHLNDSVETVIYNLTKGCGLRGLHGILPLQGYILRPLHYASKAEILTFAAQKNLEYVEDSSNDSDKYSRNFIRHQVVPALERLNPQVTKTFGENIDRLRAAEKLMDWALSALRSDYWRTEKEKQVLNLRKLSGHPCADLLLYEWLTPFGFSAAQCQNILANKESNRFWLAEKYKTNYYKADYYRGLLTIENIAAENVGEKNDLLSFANLGELRGYPCWAIEVVEIGDFAAGEIDNNIAFFDVDSLVFPMRLRRLVAGDKMQLLGMKGRNKKVSDIFKDLGVAVGERQKSWLLVDANDSIVWLLAYRTSEVGKVTDKTKQVLKISL